jgi:Na+/H+ antiporter NhaC
MASFGAASILPPLVAIIAAIVSRRAIPGLFVGIWTGAIIFTGGHGLGKAFDWIVVSIATEFHVSLLVFIFLLGGGIGLLWALGGSYALAQWTSTRLQNRRQAGIATWLLGIFVFFNDYANSAIVGTAMRDVTDGVNISREKLSYIVDSTAAPVSTFLISDWIAFQLSMIRQGYESAGISGSAPSAFVVFLGSIPYNFYCLLAIVMVGIVVISGRDYGEMLTAERRASSTGKVLRDDAQPLQSVQDDLGEPDTTNPLLRIFVIPIVLLVAVTLLGAYWTGRGGGDIIGILGNANWALSLVWGGAAMVGSAAYFGVRHRILSFGETVSTFVNGMKVMMTAATILALAWSLGTVTTKLGTGQYITNIAQGFVTPELLLVIVVLASGFISFTTGTSWGTMAIVTPIAIPLALSVVGTAALSPVVGAIFSGAIFGDHCSPISDTTVLSATFSGADLIDHVRTQLYYAVSVMLIAIMLFLAYGYLNITPFILTPIGIIVLIGLVYAVSEWDKNNRNISPYSSEAD